MYSHQRMKKHPGTLACVRKTENRQKAPLCRKTSTQRGVTMSGVKNIGQRFKKRQFFKSTRKNQSRSSKEYSISR